MGDLEALMASLAGPEAVLLRGRQFERICAWVLSNAPLYRAQLRHVWLWQDWPGRWGPDCGIDLVAETHSGSLWAIQAKAYEPAYSIKKADVDSFLSESAREQFSFRLLMASTDRIGLHARRTLDGQAVPAGTLLRTDLANLELDFPAHLGDLRAPAPKPKAPRPSSVVAVAAVCDGLRQYDRGQLIMACGTGKTLVGLWAAERLAAQRTLVLVPSLSLLAQTMREWAANGTSRPRFIAVCSDETVREDAIVSHTSELGLPVTTDAAALSRMLLEPGPLVVFATYQSSAVVAAATAASACSPFDLAIADEAHRCVGRNAGPFATILDDAAIPCLKRLFMTATPRTMSGRLRRSAADRGVEVTSMDDQAVFGPVLHTLSFADAIDQRLLSDYKVLVLGIDDPGLAAAVQSRTLVQPEGYPDVVDAEALAALVAASRTIRENRLSRLITFHNTVAAARRFAERLPQVDAWFQPGLPPLRAEHVSGAMSSGERAVRLDRLRAASEGQPAVLSNARCLSEGVDVPNLDGIVFVEPRASQVDIVQAVGRAIRRADQKEAGYIVLPVLLRDAGDTGTAFGPICKVLRALRAHDQRLGEELDALRRQLGRRGGVGLRLPDRLVIDMPMSLTPDDLEAITLEILEETTESWDFTFGVLQAYAEREGHSSPPSGCTEAGRPLGSWVPSQRSQRRVGWLRPERERLLETLPGWTWSVWGGAWQKSYDALGAFAQEHGHTRVPRGLIYNGVKLSTWINTQRSGYREKVLAPELIAALEMLPGWTWGARREEQAARLAAMASFVAREGHSEVSREHVEGDFKLGKWLYFCRHKYRQAILGNEIMNALDELAPGWRAGLEPVRARPTVTALWLQRYELLKAHVALTGTADVPRSLEIDDHKIGFWVSQQRYQHGRQLLNEQQLALLTALPGWTWSPQDDSWDRSYGQLTELVKVTGHMHLDQTDPALQRLRGWLEQQQVAARNNRLRPDRLQRLEALPGWNIEYVQIRKARHIRSASPGV